MPPPRSRLLLSVHPISRTAPASQCTAQSPSIPSSTLRASDSETESSLPLRHGAMTPWQRGLYISHQVKSGSLSLLGGGDIGPQHSKSLTSHLRTDAPAPSRSSFPRPPLLTLPYTCLCSLCYLPTDRFYADRFYAAAAGLAASSLSAESPPRMPRMQPQAQGPGRTRRQRRFELILWVVRPLAWNPMSVLAFSPQSHSCHRCVQPGTGREPIV